MGKRLLFPIILAVIGAVSANAQQSDSGPQQPNVFLDNHRPLIQKKEKTPTSRTVMGKVVDDSGQPLQGAMVTLTNTKTNERTQVVTKKDGRYNFDDVSFTIDYEVQAQYKNLKSQARKLSQYDHTATVVRILEIEPQASSSKAEAKKETPPGTNK